MKSRETEEHGIKESPVIDREMKEDFLETLCIYHNQGQRVSAERLTEELKEKPGQVQKVLDELYREGSVYYNEENQICLTKVGRSRGETCLKKHRYLTEFFKYVCGVEEESAQKNACAMEHVVSEDVFMGICAFMKKGDTYDRIMKENDLNFLYSPGVYHFVCSVYRKETSFPRALAPEFYLFKPEVRAEIAKKSRICLIPVKKQFPGGKRLWAAYRKRNRWILMDRTERGYEIPSDAFSYQISRQAPVIEGETEISVLICKDGEITEEQFEEKARYLQIHLYKENESR